MTQYIIKKDKYNIIRYYDINNPNNLHRLDGPAIEWQDGSKSWYQNGKLHRLDGPALEYVNGDKYWFQNDKSHRLDGPAIECTDGYKVYFIDGEKIECSSQEEFKKIVRLLPFG